MKVVGKIYKVCEDCGNVVQINKPIFGSLHICTTEEERLEHKEEIRKKVEYMKKELNNIMED